MEVYSFHPHLYVGLFLPNHHPSVYLLSVQGMELLASDSHTSCIWVLCIIKKGPKPNLLNFECNLTHKDAQKVYEGSLVTFDSVMLVGRGWKEAEICC